MNPQVRARGQRALAPPESGHAAPEEKPHPEGEEARVARRPLPDLDGRSTGTEVLDEPAGPDGEVAPPVVIVMVTHNPGWWFEECLDSVAAQTYDNSSLLVIDAASDVDTEEVIAEVVPTAHLQQLGENAGFGKAVNEILTSVHGAAFYLICHDDVRLDPDTLQQLVAEAYRSNAGIVGPKIVNWFHPDQLLQVGLGVDKTGVPAAVIEQGELDQEQHDSVRDTFYVPGACTLVRSDLFEAIGGFDPGISFHADDLDLCWRAHLAGARVVVAPSARVAHLEALGDRRQVDDRRRLQMRHRLRVIKSNYSWFSRVRIIPQAALLAALEMVYALVLGRFRQARDVGGAWVWNARHRKEIRERRRLVAATRTVKDGQIRRLQVRGSARLSAYLRGQIGGEQDRLGAMAASGRQFATNLQSGRATSALVAWAILLVVWTIGSRQLLGGVPAVGEFERFPSSAVSLLQEWSSGYRNAGLGSNAAAPTAFGFLGGLGVVFLGAMDLLRNVLILGMLPLGAIGIWRLCRPIGSRRAKIVGLLSYAAVPVAYNSLAQARWTGLVMYAATPWMLVHLLRASRVAPFGSVGGSAGPHVPDRPLLHHVVSLGVVTALASMLVPFSSAVVLGMAVALVVGGVLVGQLAGAWRVLLTAAGAVIAAFVLHLPWSLELLQPDWSLIAGTASLSTSTLDIGAVLRFNTGPYGSSPLAYGVLVAGGLALVVGKDWRLGWAARAWTVALGGFGLVWASSMGWLPFSLPSAEVVLAPAAAAVALAVAMGMAAFEVDLPDYHFGWRQFASVLAGAALVLTAAPVLGDVVDGSWTLPQSDLSATLSSVDEAARSTPSRVLWMGDSDVLPLRGWKFEDPRVRPSRDGAVAAYGTADHALPTVQGLYPGSPVGATEQLTRALETAIDGGTSRLGSLLAPMGIQYVIVPDRVGPAPFVNEPQASSPRLLAVLDSQLDLTQVEINKSIRVYRNVAWGPARAQLPADAVVPRGGSQQADRVLPALAGAPVALRSTDGFAEYSGELPEASTVYVAAATAGWELQVDGVRVQREDALGWSSSFSAPKGSATMGYDTPPARPLSLAGEVAVWLIAFLYLLRTRVARDERRRLGPGEPLRVEPTPPTQPTPRSEPVRTPLDELADSEKRPKRRRPKRRGSTRRGSKRRRQDERADELETADLHA